MSECDCEPGPGAAAGCVYIECVKIRPRPSSIPLSCWSAEEEEEKEDILAAAAAAEEEEYMGGAGQR